MLKQLSAITLGAMISFGLPESCSSFDRSNLKPEPPTSPPIAEKDKISSLSALEQMERSIHQQVNQYRQSLGLSPLKLDERISKQARMHSKQMAGGSVAFGHDGFKDRTKGIRQDISFRQAAENVAVNQGFADPATRAVRGWIKSDSHRQSMEGPYDLTGVGVAKNAAGEYYFTQIFIKP